MNQTKDAAALETALRAKVDAYQMAQKNYEDARDACLRFRAENERLVEALEAIAKSGCSFGGSPCNDETLPADRCAACIARAALEGK